MQYEKEKLIEQLLENEMVVTFNKVNGDERVMTCTLKPELIPVEMLPKNSNTPKEPSAKQLENIGVYDVNAKAWRSFKVANVTNVQVAEEAFEELNEMIKRPTRYYQIEIGGYGGESVYSRIPKEAYEFWNRVKEDDDAEYSLEDYVFSPEEFIEEHGDLPPEADFLYNKEDDYHQSWYEMEEEIEHNYGSEINNSWINIEETSEEDFNSDTLEDIVSTEDLDKWIENNEVEVNSDEFDLDNYADEDGSNYVLYGMSMEKGTFFSGTLIIEGGKKFDPKKLKISSMEMPNGDEIITSVEYNGEEVDGLGGGDTRGKGYTAEVWNY